jgi:hypothetical protein
MPLDGCAIEGESKRNGGGKTRLLTLSDLDSRTRACKHALDLRAGFLADLGGSETASAGERELAQRGAILGAMIEDQEARWLRGDGIQLSEYATLVNAQRRVIADIGLERRARDITPTLHELLANKATTNDDSS